MVEDHRHEAVTPYVVARIVVTILVLVLSATVLSLLLDISCAYILVEHGHLSLGFGTMHPKPNTLLITSRSLVGYPLGIASVIAILLVTKAAWNSSKTAS